jgi:hypothetical protein
MGFFQLGSNMDFLKIATVLSRPALSQAGALGLPIRLESGAGISRGGLEMAGVDSHWRAGAFFPAHGSSLIQCSSRPVDIAGR